MKAGLGKVLNEMDFNKRMAARILSDLETAKSGRMSVKTLEIEINAYLGALDSTFPRPITRLLAQIVSARIPHLKVANYAANLNTEREGLDEGEARDDSLDEAIAALRLFIGS